ncbi:MAG: hypothetical protein FJX77_06650 [Armatimonadetes bacterium]|nr:hypothetical protein [Armatimonadota bacterium]
MNENHRRASERASRGHNSLVEAMHRLEAALASPAPGREAEWAAHVLQDLETLLSVVQALREAVEGPGGLYEQVTETRPEASLRTMYLRDSNRYLADHARLLVEETERIARGEAAAFMAVRTHAAELLKELRQQQAREVDLVFETFQRDIGSSE